MNWFEVIAPHQLLCIISSKPKFAGEDATLTTTDQMRFDALKMSTQEIGKCMTGFALKQGKSAPKMGEEGAELEEDPDD